MCGIFGVFHSDPDLPIDQEHLGASLRLLVHRGPDFQSAWQNPGIGLAHTRLSLLDLSPRSHQPFHDRSGRYHLVYNGEIYNWRILRSRLESKGITFSTTSDTEVLLEMLICEGIDSTLAAIEGMYAFAFYDSQERTLFLARDRLGIKPLFLFEKNGTVFFSSEIQAMRPWVPFEPDLLSIYSYLHGFPAPYAGHTFYKGIRSIPPGTQICIRPGQAPHYKTFFKPTDLWNRQQQEELETLSTRQLLDRFDEQLLRSVQLQLLADAPVGALCSGGIDSSVIMAMAARSHNNLAVFHANVCGRESEYESARTLADHLKLDLKSVDVHDRDFLDLLPEVTRHYGHPAYHHMNSVPFLKVSRLVRDNGVKAVLSGEGADECYYGYLEMILTLRPPHKRGRPQSLLTRLWRTAKWMIQQHGSPPDTDVLADLGNRYGVALEYEQIRREIESRFPGCPANRNLEILYKLVHHLRSLLHRNDALGMAAGIEARFPYLDTELVRLAVNMPYRAKVRFSFSARDKRHLFIRDKWILRKIAERYIPASLSQRHKAGFPVSAYRRAILDEAFFTPSLTADLLEMSKEQMQYLLAHADLLLRLRLLHLEAWIHTCLWNRDDAELVGRLHDHITIQPQS
ncbi:MAG: asparagine synthase (glutamine-hydrolyzing) [Sedimentisphaerales bacterium]|nr:asparagine synthase (glutamine-hydrolyzing) [Sedimentisphaerales bacterium]